MTDVSGVQESWTSINTFGGVPRPSSLHATVSLGAMIDAHRSSVATRMAPITQLATPERNVTSANAASPGVDVTTQRIATFALAQLGKPYVFATSGPETFDCSGLVAAAYREVGIQVPAYTGTLATLGREVNPSTETIRPGDLIFMRGGSPASDLGHVGIAVSATEWVRAPRTGDVVKSGPIPAGALQMIRRLIDASPPG